MIEHELFLISGRTLTQGTGISEGKEGIGYKNSIEIIVLNETDFEKIGLRDGDRVLLETDFGKAVARPRKGAMAPGVAFMAYGQIVNQLISGETNATGMPTSKGVVVRLRVFPGENELDKV